MKKGGTMDDNSKPGEKFEFEGFKAKGKKAFKKLEVGCGDQEQILKILDDVFNKLKIIIGDDSLTKDFGVKSKFLESSKQRSMILENPKRIEFLLNGLRLYIDFTIETFDDGNRFINGGSIIYGANRTLCFSHECIVSPGEYNKCSIIERCDGLEDKPLIAFSVTSLGIIEASNKFENELWDRENPKDLYDLHYRALDTIWVDALSWTNEPILP
jgi:hypothetical protein